MVFPRSVIFFRFGDIGVQSRPYFRELREISLYFDCRYSVESLDIDFIFGDLVGLTEALYQQ